MGVFAAFVGLGSWDAATRIESRLERQARTALDDAGISASVTFAGRDAVLAGEVDSVAESARAGIVVADLRGVRRVESRVQIRDRRESPTAAPTQSPGASPTGAPSASAGAPSAPTPTPAATAAKPVPAPPIGNVLFASGDARISPSALKYLKTVAAYLKNHPDVAVRVEGHSDTIGSRAFNQALSAARARAVADRLVALGVDAARLRAKGYADTRPVASNRTSAGRAANRRVEIVIEGVQ